MLIDRYLLKELWKRLAVALSVVLISLIIERLLRLFDMVSMKGGPLDLVWQMALMLVPHYLGLALPAAFFFSVFMAMARLSRDNEFDVLMAGGVSPIRLSRPLFAAALILVAVAMVVQGYAQPHSRYGYRALRHVVLNIPWGNQLPALAFSPVGQDTVVSASSLDETTGELKGVFIHTFQDSREIVLTSKSGELLFGPGHEYYRLRLFDGISMETPDDAPPRIAGFGELTLQQKFSTALIPFRARGDDVRELSLTELLRESRAPNGNWTRAEAEAELNTRIIRSLSLFIMPLLAVPLALAAKRSQKSVGIVVGGVLLVVFHYALQTVQGLAAAERLPAFMPWLVLVAFALLSGHLFWRAQRNPGQPPLDALFSSLELLSGWIVSVFTRSRRKEP